MRYRWMTLGDINAFFGLMLDNMVNLVLLTGILVNVFHYPADIVYHKMLPGTALGVLFGDLAYSWMAYRLARRQGRATVTAMPLGLDTPSTVGMALAVLGPAYLACGDAMLAWKIGMATMVFMGVIKVIFSLIGDRVRRIIPQAGLLGSLGGVGVALLAFFPLTKMFHAPVVGLVALGLVLYTLVARLPLPKRIPGALAAVVVGTALYYILGPLDLLGMPYKPPHLALTLAVPWPTLGFLDGIGEAIKYLPLAILSGCSPSSAAST